MQKRPLLRLRCKCVKNDSIEIQGKYINQSKKLLKNAEALLLDATETEKESKRWKATKDALDKNKSFLKILETQQRELKRSDERHEDFYIDYARAFVQNCKVKSYNVQRGKKTLTNSKSAWQYGSAISITNSKKRKSTLSTTGISKQNKKRARTKR